MLLHFGIKETTTVVGAVDHCECQACLNISTWNLIQIEKYLSIFRVPIFPILGFSYKIKCESCNIEIVLKKDEIKLYRKKLFVEKSFLNGEINEVEKQSQINDIQFLIESEKQKKIHQAIEESIKWNDVVRSKTDVELLEIYYKKRHHYQASMVVAVKLELDRRRIKKQPSNNSSL